MIVVKQRLLKTLGVVTFDHIFMWSLMSTLFQRSLPQISSKQMEIVEVTELLDLLVSSYGLQCMDVVRDVYIDMNKTDLLKMLETSTGYKGIVKSCSIMINYCLKFENHFSVNDSLKSEDGMIW